MSRTSLLPFRSVEGARLAGWAVLAVGTATLGVVALGGVRTTLHEEKATTASAWTASYNQNVCLRDAIEENIPRNATVFVDDGEAYDRQRLTELATGWSVPEASAGLARYRISLVSGAACEGQSLQVVALR